MKLEVPFAIDIRNTLYLIEEQGGDAKALIARYEALEKQIPADARATDAEWQQLEQEALAASDAFESDEPTDLDAIRAGRPAGGKNTYDSKFDSDLLHEKIAGGWLGRIAGCVLGKPVECLMRYHDSRQKLKGMLENAGDWPLVDYVSEEAMRPMWDEMWKDSGPPKWFHAGGGRESLRGQIDGAPADDDLNYTVLSLEVLRRHGLDFTPDNWLDTLLGCIPINAGVATAEKKAYRNRAMGLSYPETATFDNPYREWIGAQIRTDLYGYVCPGNPERAAGLGWSDGAASHVKNGVYGAMWVPAAIAAAFVETDPVAVVLRGLEQVPEKTRFTEHMKLTLDAAAANGDDFEKTFDDIDRRLGHYHCVHTVNNACVCAAALVHGRGDWEKATTIAVMGGMDTDCNGATVGSIAGVMAGGKGIPKRWTDPFRDSLKTGIHGRAQCVISELIEETVQWAAGDAKE